MHTKAVLATFISSILFVYCTPIVSRSEYGLKESHPVPNRWKRTAAAPPEHVIDLQIGLKQGDFAELERHLFEVSDPSHARYGQHLTAEEIKTLVRPSTETSELVHAWLREHGIESNQLRYSPARDWITISLPVAKVETLIDSTYSIFEHENGHKAIRTTDWSLPLYLHEHISTIQPTNSFFQLDQKKRSKRSVEVVPDNYDSLEPRGSLPKACRAKYVESGAWKHMTTLDCVRQIYGTKDYVPQAADQNSMASVNYVGEDTIRTDLKNYLNYYRKDVPGAQVAKDFDIVLVNGAKDDQTCDWLYCEGYAQNQKAATSSQWLIGMAYPTNYTAYKVKGVPPFQADIYYDENANEPFLDWTNFMVNQTNLPQTIIQGWSDEEQTVPPSYAKAVCQQFAQLGARGVSLLVESGDFGVGPGGYCISNDSKMKPKFLPRFPASCPYVTAVGATKGFNPEQVAYDTDDLFGDQLFSSGAGISDYFATPAYQSSVVQNYLANIADDKQIQGWYNKVGRAYPDLVAQGQSIATAWDGATISIVDGADASTAIAGGLFALINDALVAAGKKPLGFLNPFIYAVGNQGFTDVTVGTTHGCSTPGFPASAGWDAASGWGTPKFKELVQAAMDYQQ